MPIVAKQVLENTALASGFRIKLEYVFNDGVRKTVKCRGPLEGDADNYLIAKEQNVLDSKIAQDLDDAIEADSDTPTEDMTQVQLYKAWMFKGYKSDDPIESYTYLVKVAQKVIDLGLTIQQLANAFNEDVETINLVLAKWQYLKTNKNILLAYKAVKDDM